MQQQVDFERLYEEARSVLGGRKLSQNSYAGSVAAALITEAGNIYCGVCIDTPCSMGFCAEHAAIAAMITAGEHRILGVIAVHESGNIVAPCGRCREFICQIHDDNHLCLVKLADKVCTLDQLLPDRWV